MMASHDLINELLQLKTIFKGETFSKCLSTALSQLVHENMPNSKALLKSITGSEDTHQSDLQVRIGL